MARGPGDGPPRDLDDRLSSPAFPRPYARRGRFLGPTAANGDSTRTAFIEGRQRSKQGTPATGPLPRTRLAKNGEAGNGAVEQKVKAQAIALCKRFPIYS